LSPWLVRRSRSLPQVTIKRISALTARRIALRAHGLTRPRPVGRVDRRHLRRVVDDIGLIQLDSVNVLDRTQHLVLFARLGPHRRDLFREAVDDLELVEAWVHEASVIPVDQHHLFHWRRSETTQKWAAPDADLLADVRRQVTERGPISVSDLDQPRERRGPWWGWDDSKLALEWLFRTGEFGATRGPNFDRRYDLIERIVPDAASRTPTNRPDAHRQLLTLATQYLGIGTDKDIADYHRLRVTDCRGHIADLVSEGTLIEVAVEGWKEPAYMLSDTPVARRTSITTLVSPFDPVVWCRPRAERLFDFHYRIEIYVPAKKRKYGYYVLPFIHRDRPRARIDLKHDRSSRTLLCKAAWSEPTDDDPDDTALALVNELSQLAIHIGADEVQVDARGDLSGAVRSHGGNRWPARPT